MRKLVVSLSILISAISAHAETIWGKADHGATLAEISQLFPEGKAITPQENQRMSNGAKLFYKIGNIDIAGRNFDAAFYFLDDKLTDVRLAYKSQEDSRTCELVTTNVHEALKAKYGAEVKNARSTNLGRSRDASWVSGSTTIGLLMYAYDTPSCSIYIGYGSRLSRVGNNL